MSDDMSRLRASAHPVRLRILSLLTGSELSATDVARELDLTHANASYHLRVLAEAGLIVPAGEEKVRGGVVKRYRYLWEIDVAAPAPDETREAGDPEAVHEQRQAYFQASAQELIRRSQLRVSGPQYAADAELWVAPEVWGRVRGLLAEAGALLHAEARPPRSEGTLHVNLTAAAFVMADPS